MSVCRLPKVGLLVAAGHPAVAERELGRARCCGREDGGAAGAGGALAQRACSTLLQLQKLLKTSIGIPSSLELPQQVPAWYGLTRQFPR